MYNLNEQPLNVIYNEMTDLSPLEDKAGVYTVKENFSCGNTMFEKDDTVVIVGDNSKTVRIMDYDTFKAEHSDNLCYYSWYKNKMELQLNPDEFRNRFVLNEPESLKVQNIIDDCNNIYEARHDEMVYGDCYKDKASIGFCISLIAFIVVIYLHLTHTYDFHLKIMYFTFIFIILIFCVYTLIQYVLYKKTEKEAHEIWSKYIQEFENLDKKEQKMECL